MWFSSRSNQPKSPQFIAVSEAIRDARTYAQSHGGDIQLLDVDDEGVVTVKLRGACAMCPLSAITIRVAVEARLREALTEFKKVVVKL